MCLCVCARACVCLIQLRVKFVIVTCLFVTLARGIYVGIQLQLIATEKTVAQNKHHRETVLADTRKAAEKQQQEYGLMARRRRLTVTAFELLPPSKDERHQNLLQQILKYEAVFDSLKLATQSHDKRVRSPTHVARCIS